ncbi:MAG: iron-sulfur cluster assembly scaffold protein [Anaerolineae bacterium]|nr:iron-sulfur cluster assembly scaffold protein [Anaerolineae bacterium]
MAEQQETDDFERWVAALQQALLERERELFSETVLQEARQPQNMGVMLDADMHALLLGPCGDNMEMFLRLQDSRIEAVAFMTDGCGPTVACGSMLTRMAQGKTLEEAAAIEAADLILALDGLPPEHVHCATLAVHTLQKAMEDGSTEDEETKE